MNNGYITITIPIQFHNLPEDIELSEALTAQGILGFLNEQEHGPRFPFEGEQLRMGLLGAIQRGIQTTIAEHFQKTVGTNIVRGRPAWMWAMMEALSSQPTAACDRIERIEIDLGLEKKEDD
jgi:hypothetical protein